jgi:glycosyltransferase involved in cell wall biosynthesis
MKRVDIKGEMIVVDNNCTDNTAVIAKSLGARVVHEPINNIARARNRGGITAQGKYLIFIDADTQISFQLLIKCLDNLKNGEICIGGSTLFIPDESKLIIKMFIGTWNWVSERMSWAAGCFVYCSKESFDAVGGFDVKVYASEEILFVKAVKKWATKSKQRFELIKDYPVRTSLRKLEWFSFMNLILTFVIFSLFPFAPRFKFFCFFWYKRPKKAS